MYFTGGMPRAYETAFRGRAVAAYAAGEGISRIGGPVPRGLLLAPALGRPVSRHQIGRAAAAGWGLALADSMPSCSMPWFASVRMRRVTRWRARVTARGSRRPHERAQRPARAAPGGIRRQKNGAVQVKQDRPNVQRRRQRFRHAIKTVDPRRLVANRRAGGECSDGPVARMGPTGRGRCGTAADELGRQPDADGCDSEQAG
jgi:hypothetical protein